MKNIFSHRGHLSLCALYGFLSVFLFLSYSNTIGTDIISKIIEMQRSIRTMRAEFVQEKHSKLLEMPIISRGVFLFTVPERFVWDYSEDMRVVSDGKRLMLYYKKLKEADIMDISKFPSLPVSFSIESLTKRYHIEVIEAGAHRYILKVTPIIESMPLREIIITLDERATPLEVKMIERTGDSSVIKFTNMKVNITIPEESFSMKVPEGVSLRKHLR